MLKPITSNVDNWNDTSWFPLLYADSHCDFPRSYSNFPHSHPDSPHSYHSSHSVPRFQFQLLQIAAIPVIMSLKTASLGSHIDFIVASSSSEGYVFTTFFVTSDFFSLPSATV